VRCPSAPATGQTRPAVRAGWGLRMVSPRRGSAADGTGPKATAGREPRAGAAHDDHRKPAGRAVWRPHIKKLRIAAHQTARCSMPRAHGDRRHGAKRKSLGHQRRFRSRQPRWCGTAAHARRKVGDGQSALRASPGAPVRPCGLRPGRPTKWLWRSILPASPLRGGSRGKRSAADAVGVTIRRVWRTDTPTRLCLATLASRRPPLKREVGLRPRPCPRTAKRDAPYPSASWTWPFTSRNESGVTEIVSMPASTRSFA